MKLRGHETFPIRKGWLNKGIRNVIETPDVFISRTENPMDILGIGANMVKSLRYWMQATKLTYEPNFGRRNQELTDIGTIIYRNDPYFEEIGTLWFVHYALATNIDDATSWYVFFNEFEMTEFSEDDFTKAIKKYISINYPDDDIPSDRTISDDFKCIINTYYSKKRSSDNTKYNPEDNIECPLTELGLIDHISTKQGVRVYQKMSPKAEDVPELVVLAIILNKYGNTNEIRISSLQNDKNSVGKVCCLDTISLHNILYKLDNMGYLKVVRTAGLDVIKLTTEMTYLDCVELYYNNL